MSTPTRPHSVLVTGDRRWAHYYVILDALKILRDDHGFDTLIHGAAQGADRLAHAAAVRLRYPTIKPYPADWIAHGNAAGPIRNEQMLQDSRPDLVLAFHTYLENSKGTKDCVTRAEAQHIPVVLVSSPQMLPSDLQAMIRQKLEPTAVQEVSQ